MAKNINDMRKNIALLLLIIMTLTFGCSSNNQSEDSLPCIDIRKKYPKKEIILTDIADISYVHLSTENKDYLYKGVICDITENTIVVKDVSSHSILFFTREGKPKSRFNRMGQGPEEYNLLFRSQPIVYDETADEVFVSNRKDILVYSSTGKYKRKITLQSHASTLVDFDDQSLLLYDERLQDKKQHQRERYSSSQSLDSCFYRISKEDGKVLEYVAFSYHDVDLTIRFQATNGAYLTNIVIARHISKCESGLFLFTPESDTIFLYGKDKIITPVICKIPLVSDLDKKIVLNAFTDIGRYQFIMQQSFVGLFTGEKSEFFYYGYDKQTQAIFEPTVSLPDYKKGEFQITGYNTYYNGKATVACLYMDLFELKKAFKENRLSGKLKELVATLNEYEDNEIYVIARFKKDKK